MTVPGTSPDRGALVWSPFADEASALAVAHTLVEEQLAACGNIVPGLVSVFAWQGQVDTVREVGLLLKTRAALLDRAVERLAQVHPYDEPAVLGWVCEGGAEVTLEWLSRLPPSA